MPEYQTNLAWDTLVGPLGADDRDGPLYQQLARALREAVRAQRIPAGAALPPSRLLAAESDPERRLELLVGRLEDAIATTFRQVAMNRFEDAIHNSRRTEGELAPDRFCSLWVETQWAMLGDAVELSGGYRIWWSYIPHFIGAPGYVYAYDRRVVRGAAGGGAPPDRRRRALLGAGVAGRGGGRARVRADRGRRVRAAGRGAV